MRRRLAALALLAGTGALGLATAPPAAANYCPGGYACLWRDTGYLSRGSDNGYFAFADYHTSFAGYQYRAVGDPVLNSASSVSNKTFQRTWFFADRGLGGPRFSLPSYTGDSNLSDSVGWAPYGFNNNLESGARCTYAPPC